MAIFLAVNRDQFRLTWSLLDLHLAPLTDADCFWRPAEPCWSVDPGTLLPDWADIEPEPPPTTSIAWLTWHVGWWWTSTLEALHGRPIADPATTRWAGSADAAREQLSGLHTRWLRYLDTAAAADLDRVAPFPWRDEPTRTVAHTISWVNGELMKNAAEIGQLRFLRDAMGDG